MLIALGAVRVLFAVGAQTTFITVLRAIGAVAAAFAQLHRSAAGAAVGAVVIVMAGHARPAGVAASDTLATGTAVAAADAHALGAHTAVCTGLALFFVAAETLLFAVIALVNTFEAHTAAFADLANAVDAAAAVHTAYRSALALADHVPKPAVVAVGAIFVVIVAFQAEVMAIAIPSRAFFDAFFASVALVAERSVKFFVITLGQQALVAG